MSYLQLADNGNFTEKYILIPSEVSGTEAQYIREDFFDDLPEYKYNALIEAVEPYQLSEEFLAGRAERKARRAARKARRADRKEQRSRRREARTAKREAKTLYKQKQAAGEEGFEKGGGFRGVLDTMTGIASNIFGGAGDLDYDIAGDIDYSGGKFTTDASLNVSDKTWIKGVPNWVVIAGGGALTLGTIYLLTKKKK